MTAHRTPLAMPRPLRPVIFVAMLLAAALLAGCSEGPQSPAEFVEAYKAAVVENRPQDLFDLLDADSQFRLRDQLQRLRGQPPAVQRKVLEQLALQRKSLDEVDARDFFAALFVKTLADRRITARLDADQTAAPGLILMTADGTLQRFPLSQEGGRWVWILPDPDNVSIEAPAEEPPTPA